MPTATNTLGAAPDAASTDGTSRSGAASIDNAPSSMSTYEPQPSRGGPRTASNLASILGSLGRGLAAGVLGTAAMTVVQRMEMKLTGRQGSSTPADAVEKVLGLSPRSEDDEQRLAQLTHWAYGTAWGGVRGLLGGFGLSSRTATPVHFALVWGSAAVLLPRIGVAPPVREWGGKQIASDLAFHGVYALATGLAFEWLERRTDGCARPRATQPVAVDENRTVLQPGDSWGGSRRGGMLRR